MLHKVEDEEDEEEQLLLFIEVPYPDHLLLMLLVELVELVEVHLMDDKEVIV